MSTDEKYFEELSEERNRAEDDFMHIELAKSTSSVMRKPKMEIKETEPAETEGQLTVDVYQTANDIVVESAIAGVKPEEIDINVSNDAITIRGERKRESEVHDEDYFYQECYWGRFSRSIILPQEVDPESASVNFKNGILTVYLPKLNRKKSKKLRVKAE